MPETITYAAALARINAWRTESACSSLDALPDLDTHCECCGFAYTEKDLGGARCLACGTSIYAPPTVIDRPKPTTPVNTRALPLPVIRSCSDARRRRADRGLRDRRVAGDGPWDHPVGLDTRRGNRALARGADTRRHIVNSRVAAMARLGAIPPDYCLIKLDERQHWHAEIQAQTHAIFGVYAFDRNAHTHLCEATPSYELRFIATDYEEIDGLTEEQREHLNEQVLSADSEPCTYMHVSDVETIVKRHPERFRRVEVDAEEEWGLDGKAETAEDAFDQILDDWNTGALLY